MMYLNAFTAAIISITTSVGIEYCIRLQSNTISSGSISMVGVEKAMQYKMATKARRLVTNKNNTYVLDSEQSAVNSARKEIKREMENPSNKGIRLTKANCIVVGLASIDIATAL
ncbi:hypothetical protein PILCRDRAFT_825754 [Piloderma croceum F 1598]|uniref:Uncharacterized protein n=1 Tax=Piloderma croceum (strain F 1598) TaxID=765440 RepID=A0A0C3EWW2_PILCF|nr:hypothetical protein PILCRDRAFT_825754 [Piloderma croceum F 1598]